MTSKITCGSASAVIKHRGAELSSLLLGGREIMWCADPVFWGKSSPILFPAVGNVRNNKTIIDGKEVNMPKHGFARDNDFSSEIKSLSEITFVYEHKMTDDYPFDCVLSISYTLYEDKLTVKYLVQNNSEKAMPFCIGAHPAIACDDLDNCVIEFEQPENASTPVKDEATGLLLDNNRINRLSGGKVLELNYDMFDNDVVYFDDIRSRKVRFIEGGSLKAAISFDGFETLGLWTPAKKRAGFLCIEPWCGSDDYDTDNGIFADKRGIQILNGGENKQYTMTISV